VGALKNPPNDAKLMGGTLRSLGFQVIEVVDADQRTLKRRIEEFGQRILDAEIALFYFAGHGMQIAGRNYLIPVGAEVNSEGEVDIEGIDVARVLAKMDAARSRINLVILDACRNNPYMRSFRSQERGLAFVQAPHGTLIAYATAPGDVAADGTGANGTYTAALASSMMRPGLAVESLFKVVRKTVRDQTGGRQTPWESSSLEGEFQFAAAEPKPAAPTPASFDVNVPRDAVVKEDVVPAGPPAASASRGFTSGEWKDEPRAGSRRVTFRLEDEKQDWELRTADGRLMCRLPCTRWVDADLGARVTDPSGSKTVKVVVPSSDAGAEYEMTLRPSRGFPIVAGAVTLVGAIFAIESVVFLVSPAEEASVSKDGMAPSLGERAFFAGLTLGLTAAAGYWWYWSRLSSRLDTKPRAVSLRDQASTLRVGIGPGAVSLMRSF